MRQPPTQHRPPPVVRADQLRDGLPFAPARVGEGPEWGGLVVEEYRGEPPSAIDLPPVSHHHLTLYLGGDRHHRVRRFIGADRAEHFVGTPEAGELTLVPAGVPGEFAWTGHSDALHVFIPTAVLDRVAADAGIDSSHTELLPRVRFRDGPLEWAMDGLLAELRDAGPGRRLYAEGLAQALGIHLLRRHSRPFTDGTDGKGAGGRLSAAQVSRVVDWVNGHLAGGVPLGAMADAAGASRFHFARSFRRTTGETPHGFVLRRRVEESQRLILARPELTLAAVADVVGFADQAHLSRCFKRQTGKTPGRWRKLTG